MLAALPVRRRAAGVAAAIGGGAITNPGRYLVLLPPINGATRSRARRTSRGPGLPWTSWDTQLTFDDMPSQFLRLALLVKL